MKHEIAELLPFYANGTLDAADRVRVETELAACPQCRADLREHEAIGGALRAREADAASIDALLDRTLARIDAPATVARGLNETWWSWPARYATAAVLVVGLGAAGVAAWHARTSPETTTIGEGASSREAVAVYRVSPSPAKATEPKAAAIRVNTARSLASQPMGAPATDPGTHHRLARRAALDLLVKDVGVSLAQARSSVGAAGGEITELTDENPRDAGAVHHASVTAEIPADRLDATLDALARVGTVTNRTINAEDVENTIVDEEARLRNLRRAETDLLRIMDRGGKTSDVLAAQQQLTETRGQIERLTAEHRSNLHRTATSTIALTLTEDRPVPTSAKPGPTARIDASWHAGLNALADALTALVASAVWCVAVSPLPLAIAGAGLAASVAVRKLFSTPRPAA